MRPRRTHDSNRVFSLDGANEDSDLWAHETFGSEMSVIVSVWEPSPEEREQIASGFNIELAVYGGQPPVALHTTDVPLGGPPPSRL